MNLWTVHASLKSKGPFPYFAQEWANIQFLFLGLRFTWCTILHKKLPTLLKFHPTKESYELSTLISTLSFLLYVLKIWNIRTIRSQNGFFGFFVTSNLRVSRQVQKFVSKYHKCRHSTLQQDKRSEIGIFSRYETKEEAPQFYRNFDTLLCSAVASKGQLISKCLFGVIVWTKNPTKIF